MLMPMHIKNRKQAGVTGRLTPAKYWASPEGQRRKALRRLDKFAALPRDVMPRLVKKASLAAKSQRVTMMATTKNSKSPERPKGRNQGSDQADTPFSRPPGSTTRTSASAGRSCRVCGSPIAGQRRNGFCSDRCRLRAGRAAKRKRVQRALASLEHKVEGFVVEMQSEIESLRADLLGENGRGEGHRRSD